MPSHPSHSITESLYRDHYSWLRAWLRRRLGNSADASDLMQDTFFRLLIAPPVVIDMQQPLTGLLAESALGRRATSR